MRHQGLSLAKPRLVTPTSSSASSTKDAGRKGLFFEPVFQQPLATSSLARNTSARSSVRSLDEVRFDKIGGSDFSPPSSFKNSNLFSAESRFPSAVVAASSSLLDAASPLARFVFSLGFSCCCISYNSLSTIPIAIFKGAFKPKK